MKSPRELGQRLIRQWESADLRESRLLLEPEAWPISLSIPRPTAKVFNAEANRIKEHLAQWRSVAIGEVVWEGASYRVAAEPVAMPTRWLLATPQEWAQACGLAGRREVGDELRVLVQILCAADALFHSLLIRRRSLWRGRALDEVLQAVKLAELLEPESAAGRPLRALGIEGVDTKFLERNESLLVTLLDLRFDGEVSHLGLAGFLGAYREGDHWLLVVDLDGGLLPFAKQRVRAAELAGVALPGRRVLIVENESCLHQLPKLPQTLAILGAGFDLSWTLSPSLLEKKVGYWGDLDSWGLGFLGQVRANLPQVHALLMSEAVFQQHEEFAVCEPVHSSADPHPALTDGERSLLRRLLHTEKGRLEQEYLPAEVVQRALLDWAEIE